MLIWKCLNIVLYRSVPVLLCTGGSGLFLCRGVLVSLVTKCSTITILLLMCECVSVFRIECFSCDLSP